MRRRSLIVAVTIGLLAGSTLGVAAQDQASIRTDLVRGVELVTEPVEPGVLRILNDGVRDLSFPAGSGEDDAAHPATSRIATGPRRSVWLFGPETFFKLGADATHEARAWDSIQIDRRGMVWALIEGGRLESFEAGEWDLKARRVLDFDLHPEGTVFMLWEDPRRNNIIDMAGPLRQRDWKDGWTKARRQGMELGDQSIEVSAGYGDGGNDSYRGFDLEDGSVNGWNASPAGGGSSGPLNDHGEVLSMASGPNGGSWFLLRYDGAATVVDGRVVATPDYWIASGSPEGPEQGDERWFEVPATPGGGVAGFSNIVVSPNRSVWLPSDDGLVHFGRPDWTWYLRGHDIHDVAIATDGKAWVQATDGTTVSTYVIDPEAPMSTE